MKDNQNLIPLLKSQNVEDVKLAVGILEHCEGGVSKFFYDNVQLLDNGFNLKYDSHYLGEDKFLVIAVPSQHKIEISRECYAHWYFRYDKYK